MKTTQNSSINKSTSFLGLGCVTFGREIDKTASFEIMDYAFDRGINFFDTAAAYGSGASETIIGEWLLSRSSKAAFVTVATKILPPYCIEKIEASVDASLKRLGSHSIDLLYLHHWDATARKVKTLAALNQLVCTGKVRALGASNFTALQLEEIVRHQNRSGFVQFKFAQNNHNFAVSDLSQELCETCDRSGIDIVTYSPLGAGFLTGKYEAGMKEDCRFARMPGHQEIYFQQDAIKRLMHLQRVAAMVGQSPLQLALSWAFHYKKVFSVLIGARKKMHIDQALDALAFNSSGVLQQLDTD